MLTYPECLRRGGWARSVTRITVITFEFIAVVLCAFFAIERVFWKSELASSTWANGGECARDAYRRGEIKLFRLGPESSKCAWSGERDGVYEIWTWPRYELPFPFSEPCRTRNESFVRGFNERMVDLVEQGHARPKTG